MQRRKTGRRLNGTENFQFLYAGLTEADEAPCLGGWSGGCGRLVRARRRPLIGKARERAVVHSRAAAVRCSAIAELLLRVRQR